MRLLDAVILLALIRPLSAMSASERSYPLSRYRQKIE